MTSPAAFRTGSAGRLFVEGDGRVKICDFGIARLTGAGTKLTRPAASWRTRFT